MRSISASNSENKNSSKQWPSASLAKPFLERLSRSLKHGSLKIVFPNGMESTLGDNTQKPDTTFAEIHLRDISAIRRLITGGDLAFAESYLDGQWSTPDLPQLIRFGVLNEGAIETQFSRWSVPKVAHRLAHFLNTNSRRQARKNIAYHYDLGNDFYALWLDKSMTYSAGIFPTLNINCETALETAQAGKYQRISEQLAIKDSNSVLEIGCGWGGFMEHVLNTTKASITGVSISAQQCEFAKKRLQQHVSAERACVEFRDYRDLSGQFDRIASIEMFEAVGERYWHTYASKLKQLLKPNGVAVLQVITIDEKRFEHYRKSTDFIQRYIFPGGMLPSEQKLRDVLVEAKFKVTDCFRFGPHYAETIRRWRNNFDDAWPTIQASGFDERFRRMWHYYLAYCEVGFDTAATDVVQLRLEHIE